jgi:hypothetical protein
MKTVADQFVETLAAIGVQRIYGIADDRFYALAESLWRQGDREWVHLGHEAVAAFAADADQRACGLCWKLRLRQSQSHQQGLPRLGRPCARYRRAYLVGARPRQWKCPVPPPPSLRLTGQGGRHCGGQGSETGPRPIRVTTRSLRLKGPTGGSRNSQTPSLQRAKVGRPPPNLKRLNNHS